MKRCWKCQNEKELAAFGRDTRRSDGLNPKCKECVNLDSAAYRSANPGKRQATCAAYRAANPEKCRAAQQAWYSKDKVRARAVKRIWAAINDEASRAIKRRWREKNPFASTLYKQRLRCAMPPWADADAILAVYADAKRLTLETGVPHEVDHFYPLKGRNVSGLHVHTNLRAIPKDINRAKSNRMESG